MAALIKAGKIRHYGLSNETTWGVCEFRRVARELGVPGPVTMQNSYSLVSRNVDSDLAETLFREQMSLLAYSPLAAGGALRQISRTAQAPAGARFTLFDDFGMRFRKPMVPEAVEAYAALAQATRPDAGRSWRWATCAAAGSGRHIIGATTMAQLAENIAGAQFELDADTLAEIAATSSDAIPNPAPTSCTRTASLITADELRRVRCSRRFRTTKRRAWPPGWPTCAFARATG